MTKLPEEQVAGKVTQLTKEEESQPSVNLKTVFLSKYSVRWSESKSMSGWIIPEQRKEKCREDG